MNKILSHLSCIEILADDLHYRASGPAFYATHLLADVVKKPVGGFMDDLRETYWLGELGALPPQTDVTFEDAASIAKSIRLRITVPDNRELEALKDALNILAHVVEEEKTNSSLLSGTVSILDAISAHALKMRGLLDQCL